MLSMGISFEVSVYGTENDTGLVGREPIVSAYNVVIIIQMGSIL